MTPSARLFLRSIRWQLGSNLLLCAGNAWAVPRLLRLDAAVAPGVQWALAMTLGLGTFFGLALCWQRVRRHRFLLNSLGMDQAMGSTAKATDLGALARFVGEPSRLTLCWLAPQLVALLTLGPWLKPAELDPALGTTAGVLSALTLATGALPLHVLIRRGFLRVLEQLPQRILRDMVHHAERTKSIRGRMQTQLVLAITTPVMFVALGSALIVSAHVRRADTESREETARILSRSSLQLRPGTTEGLKRAIERAEELGFSAQVVSSVARYGTLLARGGIVSVTTPLDEVSANVRFAPSDVRALDLAPALVSVLAAIAAAVLGLFLGNLLNNDLYHATRGVRFLGANPALAATGTTVIRRARLRPVAELFEAIERLADRFVVFSQAQEDAIAARAIATRTRGLFFASVSHDLKSPLNSILGFTHLVSEESLSAGQRESLEAIDSRARELLALIETILDAARAEEGQLSLMPVELPFNEFFDMTVAKARQLSGGRQVEIFTELEPHLPPLIVDRARVIRATATLLAYSVRTNRDTRMWLRAEREREDRLRVDIDVPHPAHTPEVLETMLSPNMGQGKREHRGLALALRLARSVIELHQGSVRVVDRGKKGAMFCVTLPTQAWPLPSTGAGAIPAPPPAVDTMRPKAP